MAWWFCPAMQCEFLEAPTKGILDCVHPLISLVVALAANLNANLAIEWGARTNCCRGPGWETPPLPAFKGRIFSSAAPSPLGSISSCCLFRQGVMIQWGRSRAFNINMTFSRLWSWSGLFSPQEGWFSPLENELWTVRSFCDMNYELQGAFKDDAYKKYIIK